MKPFLIKSPIPKLPGLLPREAFSHYFYIGNWNSFIFLAATDAKFEWDQDLNPLLKVRATRHILFLFSSFVVERILNHERRK